MPTVKNTAQTQADISGNIYTNGNNLVTAAMVASVLQNISVSYINRVTDLPLLGLKAFSATTSYLVGDCCIYTGTLYQCTTAHLGAWSAGDFTAIGGGGTGTVTSVAAGTGMSFTTITASGSVAIDTGKVPYISGGFGASAGLLKWNGSTAFTIDTSTYLTSGTGAGGNLGGTYPSPNVVGLLGSNFPTVPTSGTYQLQATTSGGSVTAWAFVAPSSGTVTGTGAAGQLAYWSSSSAQTGSNNLFFDTTNKRLSVGGQTSPNGILQAYINSSGVSIESITIQNAGSWSGNYLNSIKWRDSTTPNSAIGVAYDGTSVNMYWHSFYNGGYKNESNIIAVLKGNGYFGLGANPTSPNSHLFVDGSASFKVRQISANYTLTDVDFSLEVTTNSNVTITLQNSTSIIGRFIYIYNSGTGTVTINTVSSQTFANVTGTPTSITVVGKGSTIIQSNGANWLVAK